MRDGKQPPAKPRALNVDNLATGAAPMVTPIHASPQLPATPPRAESPPPAAVLRSSTPTPPPPPPSAGRRHKSPVNVHRGVREAQQRIRSKHRGSTSVGEVVEYWLSRLRGAVVDHNPESQRRTLAFLTNWFFPGMAGSVSTWMRRILCAVLGVDNDIDLTAVAHDEDSGLKLPSALASDAHSVDGVRRELRRLASCVSARRLFEAYQHAGVESSCSMGGGVEDPSRKQDEEDEDEEEDEEEEEEDEEASHHADVLQPEADVGNPEGLMERPRKPESQPPSPPPSPPPSDSYLQQHLRQPPVVPPIDTSPHPRAVIDGYDLSLLPESPAWRQSPLKSARMLLPESKEASAAFDDDGKLDEEEEVVVDDEADEEVVLDEEDDEEDVADGVDDAPGDEDGDAAVCKLCSLVDDMVTLMENPSADAGGGATIRMTLKRSRSAARQRTLQEQAHRLHLPDIKLPVPRKIGSPAASDGKLHLSASGRHHFLEVATIVTTLVRAATELDRDMESMSSSFRTRFLTDVVSTTAPVLGSCEARVCRCGGDTRLAARLDAMVAAVKHRMNLAAVRANLAQGIHSRNRFDIEAGLALASGFGLRSPAKVQHAKACLSYLRAVDTATSRLRHAMRNPEATHLEAECERARAVLATSPYDAEEGLSPPERTLEDVVASGDQWVEALRVVAAAVQDTDADQLRAAIAACVSGLGIPKNSVVLVTAAATATRLEATTPKDVPAPASPVRAPESPSPSTPSPSTPSPPQSPPPEPPASFPASPFTDSFRLARGAGPPPDDTSTPWDVLEAQLLSQEATQPPAESSSSDSDMGYWRVGRSNNDDDDGDDDGNDTAGDVENYTPRDAEPASARDVTNAMVLGGTAPLSPLDVSDDRLDPPAYSAKGSQDIILCLKCKCGEDTRVLSVPSSVAFPRVKSRVQAKFGLGALQFRWRDGDGDLITLTTKEDWDELLRGVAPRDGVARIMLVLDAQQSPGEKRPPSSTRRKRRRRRKPLAAADETPAPAAARLGGGFVAPAKKTSPRQSRPAGGRTPELVVGEGGNKPTPAASRVQRLRKGAAGGRIHAVVGSESPTGMLVNGAAVAAALDALPPHLSAP